MGLEIVELVLGVEEAFDIAVPDEDMETLVTVGTLYDYICHRLGLVAPDGRERVVCNSQVAFHRLRRHLTEGYGVPRRSVAPGVPLDNLLVPQPAARRAQWDALRASLGVRLPDLIAAPGWYPAIWAAVLAPLSAGIALGIASGGSASQKYAVLLLLGLAPVCGVAMIRAARAHAVHLPASCATVGLTVRAMLSYGASELIPDRSENWTREAVWDALVKVVVEQLEVLPEEVTPVAHFIDDLGAG